MKHQTYVSTMMLLRTRKKEVTIIQLEVFLSIAMIMTVAANLITSVT